MKTLKQTFILALSLIFCVQINAQRAKVEVEELGNTTGATGGAVEIDQYTSGTGNSLIANGQSLSGTVYVTSRLSGFGNPDGSSRDFAVWGNATTSSFAGHGVIATYGAEGSPTNSALLASSNYAATFNGSSIFNKDSGTASGHIILNETQNNDYARITMNGANGSSYWDLAARNNGNNTIIPEFNFFFSDDDGGKDIMKIQGPTEGSNIIMNAALRIRPASSGIGGIGQTLYFEGSSGGPLVSVGQFLGTAFFQNLMGDATSTDAHNMNFNTDEGFVSLREEGNLIISSAGGSQSDPDKLSVWGSAGKSVGGSSWDVISDARLKENVESYTAGLDLIKKIKPVSWNYTGEFGLPTDNKEIGVLAQDLQKVAPYMVHDIVLEEWNEKNEVTRSGDYLSVNTDALRYALVNAVQEQQEIIENMETENNDLRHQVDNLNQQNTELTKRLDAIEAMLRNETNTNTTNNSTAKTEVASRTENKTATLSQNTPNPFYNKTIIEYTLEQDAKSAYLQITDVAGKVIFNQDLSTKKGSYNEEISRRNFVAGTYIYSLIVDGEVMDSKKMIVSE